MARLLVGDKTLHFYRGKFSWKNNKLTPTSFSSSMSQNRRSRGSTSSSSFLPVVVLDNNERLEAFSSNGGIDPFSGSDSLIRGSQTRSVGGCASNTSVGDNVILPVLIAALAAVTFFLYSTIIRTSNRNSEKRGGNVEDDLSNWRFLGEMINICYSKKVNSIFSELGEFDMNFDNIKEMK